jgi:hypothetical protein
MTSRNKIEIKGPFFVKSLEKDFATKTLRGKNKVVYQTLENIIKTGTIKPNTKSFGYKRRLACSLLHDEYTKTYRARGIIFTTKDKPNYIAPFDMVLLAQTDNIIVQYYRIENNLHVYYNHKLIPGFKEFIFKDIKSMTEKIPNPRVAWEKVNKFRMSHGYKKLSRQKYRLVQYNELIFEKVIKIKPVAIYGYTKEARMIAKKVGLPCFPSAKKFYQRFG